ncbi:MAG: glutamate--tRNA ligase family protein, partial [Defluviitaleaceae bacterium]|nr:glutamate--tRNA ligase family protein [Defluviitaleaceae bacterium]
MIRTRYAPSPTGFMHIGNLRTALYEYLIARRDGGAFILRIEDTDQGRLVEGAADAIFETMRLTGLSFDEGPGIGGDYGPYVQSERKADYLPHAKRLVDSKMAYYCFCDK